jgi:hypothetical protein
VDRLGVTIADELHRVKAELERERRRRRELERSRNTWKQRAQERQAALEQRTPGGYKRRLKRAAA